MGADVQSRHFYLVKVCLSHQCPLLTSVKLVAFFTFSLPSWGSLAFMGGFSPFSLKQAVAVMEA